MKALIRISTLLGLIAIVGGLTFSCSSNSNGPNNGNGKSFNVNDSGYSNFDPVRLREQLNEYPKEPLSEDEESSLKFMREEEKLARDVYDHLYGVYGKQVFDNISESEQTHTDAVLALTERYELDDPAANTGPGEFVDPQLQTMYNQLIANGEENLIAGLTVGAVVEEVDLIDLAEWSQKVDNADIQMVYDNLARGSRNHLRAFVRNLSQQGVTYEPKFLDQDEYEDIVNSDIERGN